MTRVPVAWLSYEDQADLAHQALLRIDDTRPMRPDDQIAMAQVHALLALAAAVAGNREGHPE